MQERYAVRNKAGKGRLLDEFCEQHGYERKHAIKLLNRRPEPKVPRPRPGPDLRYEAVREVLRHIWQKAE